MFVNGHSLFDIIQPVKLILAAGSYSSKLQKAEEINTSTGISATDLHTTRIFL